MPPDALVVRFSPTLPDRVLDRARTAYEECGRWELSVFVGTATATEDSYALLDRLLTAAFNRGIGIANNPNYWRCAQAAELLDLGFTFTKGGDPGEPAEHWNVDLGDSPSIEDVGRFLDCFTKHRRPVVNERMDL